MNFIIKRRVVLFNLNLVYDGKEVRVEDGERVIERKKCKGTREAGEVMRRVEEELHKVCVGLC